MRITKVYTRTGDAGKTRLAGGQQVWKDSLRVEAYGTLDELNAVVGVVRVKRSPVTDLKAVMMPWPLLRSTANSSAVPSWSE